MTRRRLDAEHSRALILDAAERLMQRDGYAVVNTRSVALEAGVKPPLVHYHFATTDNLLLACYRRSADRSEQLLRDALASDRPLHAIWAYNCDLHRTALAAQFMALANQRPSIRAEMARNVERFRIIQGEALQPVLGAVRLADNGLSPDSAAMLIAAIGRALVMETSIGIDFGHEGLRAAVEAFIDRIEPV